MNRRRLDAEEVRDTLLVVSDRLDLSMGGPAVQMFRFKDDHSPVYDYAAFDPDSPNASCRSIYRFIVRSVPDPFMDCLDAADPNCLVPKRNATLTALQALSMLNDAFVLRQCEHFAERLAKSHSRIGEQVEAALWFAYGRDPSGEELQLFSEHAAKHGLESVCRILFNASEFVFVD